MPTQTKVGVTDTFWTALTKDKYISDWLTKLVIKVCHTLKNLSWDSFSPNSRTCSPNAVFTCLTGWIFSLEEYYMQYKWDIIKFKIAEGCINWFSKYFSRNTKWRALHGSCNLDCWSLCIVLNYMRLSSRKKAVTGWMTAHLLPLLVNTVF